MYYFIEPMLEEDIVQVQAVERESFDTRWSPTTYRRELRNQATSRYIVARASHTPPPPRQHLSGTPQRRNGLLSSLFASLFKANLQPNGYPLVGYGGLWLNLDEGHITTIAVALAHRGQGVGELLLNGLIDQALDMGALNLTLEVRVSNIVAQQLYLKYGFQPVGKRIRYYTDNGEDALIMWTDPITTPAYQARLKELRQQLFARLRSQVQTASHKHEGNGTGQVTVCTSQQSLE